jgi:hypothetical protein
MGNRVIDQKKLKMKRRNRHAVFSGSTTKYAVRIDRGRYEDVTKVGQEPNEDWVPSGKHVTIPVGEVSLSKAVINTGRGPDAIRMQEYYQRIHSFDEALPKTLGFTGPMKEMMANYERIIKDTPRECRIRLVNNHDGVLDLFFTLNQWFFVDVDYKKKTLKRSKVYPSKAFAMMMMTPPHRITWVEQIPK